MCELTSDFVKLKNLCQNGQVTEHTFYEMAHPLAERRFEPLRKYLIGLAGVFQRDMPFECSPFVEWPLAREARHWRKTSRFAEKRSQRRCPHDFCECTIAHQIC